MFIAKYGWFQSGEVVYLLARHERHVGQPVVDGCCLKMSLSWSVRQKKVEGKSEFPRCGEGPICEFWPVHPHVIATKKQGYPYVYLFEDVRQCCC